MYLHETLIIFLTTSLLVGTPIYMYLRKLMVNKPALQGFKLSRVIKITSINVALNLIVFLIFLFMLVSVLNKQGIFNIETIMLSAAFFIVTGLTFYGSGIYITSVVLEAFTLPDLRRINSYKTQFIATHLFHGPISHILVYTGYIVALFLLSVLDISTGAGANITPSLMILCGITVGIIYSAAQAFNGTIPYQFITSTFTLFIFGLVCLTNVHAYLLDYSLSTFFVSFSVTFLTSCLIFFGWRYSKTKNIWDMSGY